MYQLELKRCIPLEAGHMLLSDGLFFSEFTDEDIHPSRLRACLLACMRRERASQSERDWAGECGRGLPQLQHLPRTGTWEGHPEQNRVYASVLQLWPYARQTGLLPGNKSLCFPGLYGTWHIYVNHAWPHFVSWIKHTSKSHGCTSPQSNHDDGASLHLMTCFF